MVLLSAVDGVAIVAGLETLDEFNTAELVLREVLEVVSVMVTL